MSSINSFFRYLDLQEYLNHDEYDLENDLPDEPYEYEDHLNDLEDYQIAELEAELRKQELNPFSGISDYIGQGIKNSSLKIPTMS